MSIPIPILAAFAAMVCWGVGDFLIQRLVRKLGEVQTLGIIGIIGSISLLPFIWSDLHVLVQLENIFLLVTIGIIVFFSAWFNFHALKIGKLGVVEFVLEIELPITIFLGIVFFQESISFSEWAWIGFLFMGIILISLKKISFHSHHFIEKGVVYAAAATIFMGSINFLTASAARTISPFLAIAVPWLVAAVVSVVYLIQKKELKKSWKKIQTHGMLSLSTGIIDTMAWVFFALALSSHSLSITTAITESYAAVALLLGVWVNQEKVSHHQWLGALLALVASVGLGLLS